MLDIFISHSSSEAELSKYFAQWLEKTFPATRCFCSSRPHDLPPGRQWLRDIFGKARKSALCLMMLSPYSANNSWLHFEAGMVLGVEIDQNKVIPVLFGDINKSCIPPTVQHLQYLFLEEQVSFDAFISEHLLNKEKPSSEQNYGNFMKEMNEQAKRILKYGVFGSWIFKDVRTYPISHSPLRDGHGEDSFTLKRYNNSILSGQIITVRIKIIPRRIGNIQHWKFGITLCGQGDKNQQKRVFQFHAGCHAGLNSWTLYFTPLEDHPVNEPAKLETERACVLQLWLSPDKSSVACVGIDSDSRFKVITNDRGENLWRLYDDSWTHIFVSGWADGNPFQIDLLDMEIDTIPYIDAGTWSLIGGNHENIK